MKKLLTTLFFLPVLAFAQGNPKIKTSEFDKFLKKYRIQTSQVMLKGGLTDVLAVQLRSVDTTIFFDISGIGPSAGIVRPENALIFLFNNDSTLSIYPKDIQYYDTYQYNKTFNHEYYISYDQLLQLKQQIATGIRIYNTDGYSDTNIKIDKWKNVSELIDIFQNEYKAKATSTAP